VRRPGRLFRKYALVFAALVGGALVLSGAVQALFAYGDEQRAVALLEREKALGAATRIEQFIREIELEIGGVLQPAYAVGAVDLAQLQRDYLRVLRNEPAIAQIRYLDASGREQLLIRRTATDLVASGIDASREPAFVEARAKRSGSGVLPESYYSPITFRDGVEPLMTVARADPGLAGGVTSAEVNLKLIYDVISQIHVGETGLAYVVDRNGTLIAHPDISLVLRKTELGHLPQVQAARAGVGSGENAFVAPDVAGHQVVTAWDAIVPLGWTVFVQQPIEEAFAPLYASVARTIALVTLGLVIAVAASLVLARRMVRPVQVLQAGAARIGAGALEQRIEIQTGDELEDLAAEFNRMTARLRESYTTLEQKVDVRTKALAESLDENVRLVTDLREASRRLAQASQNKSDFLANMSHELRTPLNAVIGFSDVLLEGMFGEINDRQREYLDDILTSGKHLLSLVNDILDLSKVEAGKMELQPSVFSLREVVESGAMMVRERAINQRIALSVEIEPDLAPVVADERKVKQVLFNLLSNAVKFTPAGGRIEVRACRLDGEVLVSVHDTGVGIAPEDQSRIFEEFQQAKTGARTEESTGLGLTLAKRFIELHGGRLWVESVVGQGSTFTFALPLHPIVAGAPVAVR